MPNKYNIQAQRQELDRLIRERAWNKFRILFTLLTSNQANCKLIVESHRQTSHRTLLHYVCDLESNHPPADVVALIATSCPRALFTSDSKSRLPLHHAIRHEAGIETIQALVESTPKNDDHYSKEIMLLHVDSSISTPLLLASKMDVDFEIIKYLVNQDASGRSLLKPISARKKGHKLVAPLKEVATRQTLYADDGLDSPDELLRFMLVRTYWARLKGLILEVYHLQNYSIERDESKTCLLQAAIVCHELFGSTKLASSIVSTIVRNRLHQPHHRDCFGNTTLHIACLSDTSKFDQVLKLGQRETDYGINSEDCTLVVHLMRDNASLSTNFVAKNNFGDTPLHCAIRTGKDILHIEQLLTAFEQSAQVATRRGELPIHLALKYGATQEAIMTLWKAYQEAVLIADKLLGCIFFRWSHHYLVT